MARRTCAGLAWSRVTRVTLGIALSLGLAGSGLGCDRRLAPYVPPEEEPPPVEGPVRIPGLESPVSQSSRTPPVNDAASIRGTIRVAPGIEANGSALFVIARSPAGGPPLAVRRLRPGPFPVSFALGPGDAMIPERPLAGAVRLTARLDSDGDATTRQSSDLVAEAEGLVRQGQSAIELVLKRPAN